MTFQQKLDAISNKNNSLLCVGPDPDIDKLPEIVKKEQYPQFVFNKAIIDATHDVVNAYKPNAAFYEQQGAHGIAQLKLTCDYIHDTYPEIPIIFDAKRGDIGSTNKGYAQFAFEYLRVDAITLHPYLGKEALEPFLEYKEKGCIILCRTSNPGAGEFQDLVQDGKHVYEIVAERVANDWNKNNNCFLVVGATYPKELSEVRKIVGDMTLLIPGIGAQGGDVQKTVEAGINSMKTGMIISTSRAVIFASSGDDFAPKAREAATKLRDQINTYRTI